jgi:hypothetical protein
VERLGGDITTYHGLAAEADALVVSECCMDISIGVEVKAVVG